MRTVWNHSEGFLALEGSASPALPSSVSISSYHLLTLIDVITAHAQPLTLRFASIISSRLARTNHRPVLSLWPDRAVVSRAYSVDSSSIWCCSTATPWGHEGWAISVTSDRKEVMLYHTLAVLNWHERSFLRWSSLTPILVPPQCNMTPR